MKNLFLLLLVTFLGHSCVFFKPFHLGFPTSRNPGYASPITNFPYNVKPQNPFEIDEFKGFYDGDVLKYKLIEFTKDTLKVANPVFEKIELLGDLKINLPNFSHIGNNKLMDMSEISNLDWAEFLHFIKTDSSEVLYQTLLPNKEQLPREDYFENPFFRLYPVVGITYEQVKVFCQWRQDILIKINEKELQSKGLTLEVRLPTEAEWNYCASYGTDLKKYPQGSPLWAIGKINPKAAQYLKQKHQLSEAIMQIEKDIKEFNKRKGKILLFNAHDENAPYFLSKPFPSYVYSNICNNLGILRMEGNVAEMIEEKGISKGGSYADKIEDCEVLDRGVYVGASPTVGFRNICEVKKK